MPPILLQGPGTGMFDPRRVMIRAAAQSLHLHSKEHATLQQNIKPTVLPED